LWSHPKATTTVRPDGIDVDRLRRVEPELGHGRDGHVHPLRDLPGQARDPQGVRLLAVDRAPTVPASSQLHPTLAPSVQPYVVLSLGAADRYCAQFDGENDATLTQGTSAPAPSACPGREITTIRNCRSRGSDCRRPTLFPPC